MISENLFSDEINSDNNLEFSNDIKGNNEFLKSFKESSTLVYISKIHTGEYIYVNEVFLDILRYERDEIIGKSSEKLNIFVNCMNRDRILKELKEKRHIKHYETEIKDKKGKIHMGLCSADIIQIASDEYIVMVIDDITEKIKDEEKIKEIQEKFSTILEKRVCKSHDKFKRIAENLEQVFWLIKDNKFEYISPAYEKVWGKTCRCLYDNPNSIYESIYMEDRERIYEILNGKDFLETGYYNVEFRITKPEGEICWIHGRSFPVFDGKGNITSRAGISENVTERKKVEKEVTRTNNEISKLYELYSKASQHIETYEWIRVAQKTIMEMIYVDISTVHLYNKEKNSLSLNSILGGSYELANSIKSLKVVAELTGVIVKTRKSIFLKVEDYPEIEYKHYLTKKELKVFGYFQLFSQVKY